MPARHTLKQRLERPDPVFAPLVLNPLMARLAAKSGFEALYLGGGAMGYEKTVLEANISLTEMSQSGLEIVSACDRPLILDGACGWGDPMHQHRTITVAESAGFAGIEIEDQILPKRAHHHIGIEHMIPTELMAAKVKEAVAARRDESFLIIARTNAVRASNIDDAVHRLEAYKEAGADALLAIFRTPEEARFISERLPPPLVYLCRPGGLASIGLSAEEMGSMGYKLLCDPTTALLAIYQAVSKTYAELADGYTAEAPAPDSWSSITDALYDTIEMKKLLDIERATVETG
jgi:2-methylisocitrate lyase-like PEP mutase family enzyme